MSSAGANENDFHYLGVDMNRDIKVDRYLPLRAVQAGDPCARCGMPLQVSRVIEVGHIFKLGTRYSEALGAYFLDENGTEHPIIMGSYGIGVERIMACAIEMYYNGSSMLWPREIAPFLVEIVPLNVTHEQTRTTAEDLYAALMEKNISVLFDDRDERAGVKFKDADLFGAPVEVVIGEKNLKEGHVEVRVRDKGIVEKVPLENMSAYVFGACKGE